MKQPIEKSLIKQQGLAIVLVLIFILMIAPMITAMLVNVATSTTHMSMVSRNMEEAYQIAEGGIHATIFRAEVLLHKDYGDNFQNFIIANNSKKFTGNINGGSYEASITGPITVDGNNNYFKVTSTGTNRVNRQRTIEALIHGPTNPKSLDYTLYGNFAHFDNHNKTTGELTMTANIYSNSSILIDGGVLIDGQLIAVEDVKPDTGPSCNGSCKDVLDTIFTKPALQGNRNPSPLVATALVTTMSPMPPILPFPTFDFDKVKALAQSQGTYMDHKQWGELIKAAEDFGKSISNAQSGVFVPLPANKYPGGISSADLPVEVMRRINTKLIKNTRLIKVPTILNPLRFTMLGSKDGLLPPEDYTLEIVLRDNRAKTGQLDQVYYVEGPSDDVKIELGDRRFMLRVEGSLIVEAKELKIKAAMELLAWENRDLPLVMSLGQTIYNFAPPLGNGVDMRFSRYPALAVKGPIKLETDKGPTHVEGVVYSTQEAHLHPSKPEDFLYMVGNQTADIMHVCDRGSYFYDPEARKTLGFSSRTSGRTAMTIVRLDTK